MITLTILYCNGNNTFLYWLIRFDFVGYNREHFFSICDIFYSNTKCTTLSHFLLAIRPTHQECNV